MNPNHTNNVLGHLLIRTQQDNQAWQTENERIRNDMARTQERMHSMLVWNRELINQSILDGDNRRRMQEGVRIVMESMDELYNVFINMRDGNPQLDEFGDDITRIVLRAEVGRALMVQEIIDLTGEETDEDTEEEEV